jgi:phosphonate transport system substrate-binding protein
MVRHLPHRPLAHPLTRRTILAGFSAAAAGLVVEGRGLRVAGAQDATPAAATPVGTPIATPSTGPTPTLNMGLIPAEDIETILRQFEPLTDYLEAELEVEEFNVFRATDYTAVIEAMRSKQVDIAWFGPFSYVLAHEVAGARSLVVVGTPDGQPATYRSLIVANAGTGITDLEGIRGRSFAFVDPASTSGYLIPRATMVGAGLDPDQDLGETRFAGGHDASLLAVANGQTDAGAVADVTYRSAIAEGLVAEADVVIVAESDPIPESPFAVRDDLDPGLRERLKRAFLSAHEVLGEETINGILDQNGGRFVEAPDSLYDPLREVVQTLDLNLADLAQ